jgi:hypothetical protein
MARYDSDVIQEYANKLYFLVYVLKVIGALLGAVVGWAAFLYYFSPEIKGQPLSPLLLSGLALGALLGG